MSAFTAADVQALRKSTGAGMMDAKRALQACDGDAQAAALWLREKGLASTGQRRDRVNQQGAVAISGDATRAAIAELRCETDYVAKSDQFTTLVAQVAAAVAVEGPGAAQAMTGAVQDLAITLKENIELGRVVHFEAEDGAIIDSYLHQQSGRGVNAVMVEVAGASPELAHDLALHIASMRPGWLSGSDVPAERIAEERAIAESVTRNEGKPEAAIPKIVDGRVNGWIRDNCLLEQAFVRDSKISVTAALGSARIVRFAQVEIGGSSGG
ncbi:MAG: translation elongation factor Ts [Acidimicrobiales bacterium]